MIRVGVIDRFGVARLAVAAAVFVVGCGATARVASRDSTQRAGRDAVSDMSADTDLLDAKGATVADLSRRSESTGIDQGKVEGENIINVIAGGVTGATPEDWLMRLTVALATLLGLVAALMRSYMRVRGDLVKIVRMIEGRHGGTVIELKGDLAKDEAGRTSLGKLVRKVTQ